MKSMIVSPVSNVIVKIDTKHIANLSNMIRIANLNPQSQINPADYVNVIGEVISVPKLISKRHDYIGFSSKDIQKGDKAIFSYAVIFSFTENENGTATYKNLFWYKGQEYWKVDIQNLYAVIRNGQIIMVNGYCMVEEMSEPSAIILSQSMKKIIRASTATLTNIGNNLEGTPNIEAKAGDTVHYNPAKLIQYQVNGKKFGILQQKHICGVEVGLYGDVILDKYKKWIKSDYLDYVDIKFK
jgi:co-chaperonin GroES (HSP10)